jgi:hypothetical protein
LNANAGGTGPSSNVAIGDGSDVALGAKADAQATDFSSSWTLIALAKGLWNLANQAVAFLATIQTDLVSSLFIAGGNVGGFTKTFKINPTISTSAYSAGNTVGAIQTLTSAVQKTNGTAILESLILLDKSNQKAAMDIFIFDVNPAAATTTDHAAFAFSTNDVNVIARISVAASDYITVNSEAVAVKSGLGIAVQASASANLYAVAVTSGTPTYSATALQWVWGFLQD